MVCSYQCAIDYANSLAWSKRKNSMKDKLKTQKQKVNEVRIIFQKMIRERDKHLNCISCNTSKSAIWHAGHYLKAEIFTGLIFNEDNVHKQCLQCNNFKNGNEILYRENLIKKIGLCKVLALESNKNDFRLKKYTDDELQEIKEYSKKKYLQLKQKNNAGQEQ